MRRFIVLMVMTMVAADLAVPIHAAEETAVDHAILTRVLKRVARDGRVDYLALRADRADLDMYLSQIARANPTEFANADDRLAFWLNAYNALVLDAVLDSWPLASVRDVPGFFTQRRHRVAGREMTLREIMNDKLRAAPSDPRIVFAAVWGCIGCAPLRPEAYSGKRLRDELDKAVAEVMHNERYVRVDGSAKIVYVPEFLKWYAEDFRGIDGGLIGFLKKHLPEQVADASGDTDSFAISYRRFDWGINIARLPTQ